MVDRQRSPDGEAGTTLAELLVAMTILLVLGSITTVGLVQGFGAQLVATNVAETLDGTRIATQRVRDFVRAADEVCASSTGTNLVLWTDDDDDGAVVDTELDIFELVPDASGEDVFQRRTPGPIADETQLIRDDIINAALFTYDIDPADQPNDLVCTDGVTPTNGPNAIRVVDVQFTVENPDPADPDLTTATSVRLRNADLVDGPQNQKPDSLFTFTCPQPDRTCTFDGSSSTDTDGTIASYTWTFKDSGGTVLGTATGVTTSFTFPLGNVAYDVTLDVVDDLGGADTSTQPVTPVEPGTNVPPTAAFTFGCTGRICSFDATTSSDDVGIASYAWTFGAAGSGTGVKPSFTFPTDGDYGVTLTVTDAAGATGTVTRTVTARTNTIYVSSVTGAKANGNTLNATVVLTRTTAGTPAAGTLVTFNVARTGAGTATGTCTTSTASPGTCTAQIAVKNKEYPVTITIASVSNTGPYVYDEDLNTNDTATVS